MTGMLEQVAIPFRLVGGTQPLILLPALINQRGPFEFVLDTGAGLCLTTRALAFEVGILATATQQGHGAGGAVALGIGSADSISVGNVTARGVRVGITDEVRRIAAAVGARVDGAVGYDFLRSFQMTIDYASRTVALETPRSRAASLSQNQTTLSFKLASKKPLVLLNAYVGELGPFRFALDTGASTTAISPRLASRLDLSLATIPDMTGGGGSITASASRIRSLRVGSSTAEGLDVAVTDALDIVSEAIGQTLDGILGYNFLSRYRVIVDYPNESLTLTSI